MARPRREEPVLKKRENGIWYATWYDGGLKRERRQSLDTRDHAAAAIKFAEFLVKGPDDPRVRPSVPGLSKPTVEQVLDWYEKDHVNAAEGPVAKERQRYAIAALKSFFRDRQIADVDIELSRSYRVARLKGLVGERGRCVGVATVRRELGVLVAAANHARAWKRIGHDEMPSVELPTEAGAHEKKPWLTKASIRLALEKAEGDLRDFILFAYYWGSRRQAIEQLRKGQIDLQHGTVDLHPPGARRTKKRKPVVPIYPEVRPALERRLTAAKDYLFPARSHQAGRDYADFYDAFKTLCDRHEIKAVDAVDDVPWPHLLRHSRATHMLMDGESLYKVAKLLGDTVATVERVYGHHSVEFLATQSNVEEVA
ncbi:tyrosine-type recombinase/integrase [Bradyrhizobium stylosanthis]|uniref:Phage integrase family protein n=1 Tax=Bradyrhizobium stylosanthis TaxID=1803665 RepID=A0A560CXM3_9BRAD|nr:site-specific integrase [Bradyrhizobium stylosanthis]TWA89605.1 phage integrase family protein [Bradyrhizobium stylosanthis]